MQSINGATSSGSPIHSDNPGPMEKTEQENGRVKAIVTSHMLGNSQLMPGERDLGNPSRNSPT